MDVYFKSPRVVSIIIYKRYQKQYNIKKVMRFICAAKLRYERNDENELEIIAQKEIISAQHVRLEKTSLIYKSISYIILFTFSKLCTLQKILLEMC